MVMVGKRIVRERTISFKLFFISLKIAKYFAA